MTSETLATLGLFGRVEALLNDFIGGGLVSQDEFDVLTLTANTVIGDEQDVQVDLGTETRHSAAVFANSAIAQAMLGDSVAEQVQVTLDVGPYQREIVQFLTRSDGAVDAQLTVDLQDQNDAARFQDEVSTPLRALFDDAPNVKFSAHID